MQQHTPLVLMILDGWGYRQETSHNAIAAARTPQWDAWWQTQPHTLLQASGEAVGLPNGQMGNSEVGHMHIGAGRVIPQDLTRIHQALTSGAFAANPIFIETIEDMKRHGKAIHVMGLLSAGGVHSHEEHLFAFLALCAAHQFSSVYLHLFLDGRDTPPQSALVSIAKLQTCLAHYPVATIASITGRYYAMDRDQRWARLEPVYQLLTEAHCSKSFNTAEDAIQTFYTEGIYDEFIPPTCIGPAHPIQDGDAVFFFNFRADRARQLTQALIADSFPGFIRPLKPLISHFITMTHYAEELSTTCAFPPFVPRHTLGEMISNAGLTQLRLAETEKYAHVTFFLNGGSEELFPGEKRILIPSPHVSTYDLQPEMSAPRLTEALVEAILTRAYDFIVCNYANADMVGHTGHFNAAVRAIESLDTAMHDVWQALNTVHGQLLITADHGNAECMFDDTTHQAHTAHTNQPVPFMYIGQKKRFNTTEGRLTDVAPTVLSLLGITPPKDMTGKSLLEDDDDNTPH